MKKLKKTMQPPRHLIAHNQIGGWKLPKDYVPERRVGAGFRSAGLVPAKCRPTTGHASVGDDPR